MEDYLMLDRYANATIADLEPELAEWDWSDGIGPFLWSPTPGTGKTHAAYAMWRELGFPGEYVSLSRMMQAKRDCIGTDTRYPEPNWKQVPFVVFDDFGKERMTAWVQEQLFVIIDTLYSRCVPIIVTSNLGPAEVESHAGKFVTSRFKEMVRSVPMLGVDRRGVA